MQKRKRDQSRQLQRDEHELLETPRKKQNCAVAEESQEIKMEKVIQSFHDSIKCGLNIYVVAVISYGIDHQLQNVMLINTPSAQKIYLMFV